MHAPNSAPRAPVVEAPAPPSRESHGARRASEGRPPQAPGSWLNTNGSKLGLGLTALGALSLIPFASLTIQAFAMIVAFMALIMTKRMSVLTALIIVPIIFALLGGFGPEIGPMMLNGVKAIAPTAAMLMFAILFFGIMIDVGLFDPVVRLVIRAVHGDPLRIVVGTAVLALVVSLDGDGATTYLVVTAAMLPLYTRLGMNRLMLACVIMMAGGVMNILPWGGPTARAAAALKVDAAELFVPMIPAIAAGAAWVIFVAWLFGRKERQRVGVLDREALGEIHAVTVDETESDATSGIRRPKLLWINALLTAALMTALLLGVLPLSVLFMIACALALTINYPTLKQQRDRIEHQAGNVLSVVSVILAAGILTGILSGTKMVDAMANSVVALVPDAFGPYLAIITGVLSLPFTFFISNDAFYYGVVPILSQAAAAYGISAAEIGRASLVGQPVHLLSPLVPSTYLLVALVGVELGDHQRFTLKWTIITAFILLAIGLATATIPLAGGAH
jgi:citrate-Mg2+:H+ or citrate-Ca2+:H+ symporter, CitMHS family